MGDNKYLKIHPVFKDGMNFDELTDILMETWEEEYYKKTENAVKPGEAVKYMGAARKAIRRRLYEKVHSC